MIFISYNHQDQDLIDMIARKLEIEFGRDNIFYDKWSIEPGESIIGEMDRGIESYSTFFFMLSPNSLESNMVTKEWQAALMRKINSNTDLKFIPIRIDNCQPPAILGDELYIDLYGEGLDSALVKMKNVVKNESTYSPHDDISNLQHSKERISETKIKITVFATMYSEHNLSICIGLPGISLDNIDFLDASETISQGNTGDAELNGKRVEFKVITLMRPLDKEIPFYVTISTKNKNPIENIVVGHHKEEYLQFIPEKV